MKRMPTIIPLLVLLAAGAAQAQFINRIGVYSSPIPTWPSASISNPETNIHFSTPGVMEVYVVCVNPYNTITDRPISSLGGYEFNVRIDLAWFLIGVTLPEDVLDFDAANEAFYCSGLVPVTTSGENQLAHLATLRLFHFDPNPGVGLIYLEPYFVVPSIPDHMAVTDALDNFSLHQADPASWDYGLPVCYINYFWDAPEDRSWGDVKALFR